MGLTAMTATCSTASGHRLLRASNSRRGRRQEAARQEVVEGHLNGHPAEAIRQTLQRLDKSKITISTICGDISTIATQENLYDLWHDRAVFHFLTEASQRTVYIQNLKRSLKKGGVAIVATFGPNGPDKCSGLNTLRYDAETLQAELGNDFQILGSRIDYHQTPFETSQQFLYCWFRFLPTITSTHL